MVTLTEKAARHVSAALAKQGRPGGCLRLKVSSGGCSGMSYEFAYADAPDPADQLTRTAGVTLAVDAKAYLFVNGAEIDWRQSLMESGFAVKNPNATAACNCGTSFSTLGF